jgi:HSP20 family protein
MLYRKLNSSPWEDLERMQREMNRLFNGNSRNLFEAPPSFPAVNLWASDEGQIVTAELPGVDLKDIELLVVGNMLTINGKREPEETLKDARVHRQERESGNFNRTIQLPYLVNVEKVEAVLESGLLRITLPRADADKPKKISVKNVS